MTFDSTSVFGNQRSKRYALTVENGKVTGTFIEPDNTGVNGMHIPDNLVSNNANMNQPPRPRRSLVKRSSID